VIAEPEKYEIALEPLVSLQVVTLEKLDEDRCNPLGVWIELGKPVPLSKDDVEYFIGKSKLEMETITPVYENGSLKLQGRFGVNDIHCYKISK